MNESKLRKDLAAHLRKTFPGSVVLCHEDEFTAGIPDISFSWAGNIWKGTTWMELKHVTVKKPFKSTGLQQRTAIELSRFGGAWYVVYEERKIGGSMESPIYSNTTFIVHPGIAENYRDGRAGTGFNHFFVADFLREIYGS